MHALRCTRVYSSVLAAALQLKAFCSAAACTSMQHQVQVHTALTKEHGVRSNTRPQVQTALTKEHGVHSNTTSHLQQMHCPSPHASITALNSTTEATPHQNTASCLRSLAVHLWSPETAWPLPACRCHCLQRPYKNPTIDTQQAICSSPSAHLSECIAPPHLLPSLLSKQPNPSPGAALSHHPRSPASPAAAFDNPHCTAQLALVCRPQDTEKLALTTNHTNTQQAVSSSLISPQASALPHPTCRPRCSQSSRNHPPAPRCRTTQCQTYPAAPADTCAAARMAWHGQAPQVLLVPGAADMLLHPTGL